MEELWSSQPPTIPSPGRVLAARRNKLLKQAKERSDNQEPNPEAEAQESPVDQEQSEAGAEKRRLREELLEAWRCLADAGPGSTVASDPDLLDRVEKEMEGLWTEQGDADCWKLCCLVYAGIEVIAKRSKQGNPREEVSMCRQRQSRLKAKLFLQTLTEVHDPTPMDLDRTFSPRTEPPPKRQVQTGKMWLES